MYRKLNTYIYNSVSANVPWTNVYGLARTILALATAMTLAINDASIFFKPSSGVEIFPNCSRNISIFCLVPNDYFHLNLVRWICVILLIIIASGWRPNITGVIHWWISYSFNVSAIAIDGGEQVASVFTLLLIPVTLTDPRKWHWQKFSKEKYLQTTKLMYFGVITLVTFLIIRVQVAILYFNSTVAKLGVEDWINGTAVYYYVQDPMLGFPPFLLNLVKYIIESPLIVIPTWGTLIIQMCLFAFLFAPKKHWRKMFFIAIFFHEIIAVMLGLISFSMAMLAVLILYLRPIEKEFHFKKLKPSSLKGVMKKSI